MLGEVNNPASNLILNLFFVRLPVMATDSLLTERNEKTKCGGMAKKTVYLELKGKGSILDLTEGAQSCKRNKKKLSQFSQMNNSDSF